MDQHAKPPTKRAPTPASWKPGQSGNPRGRPRSGLALAERIRERMSPDELIDLVTTALADPKIDIEKRVSLAMQLASYGYSKPPAGLDLNVSNTSDELDLSNASEEQLRAALEILEAPASEPTTNPRLDEPSLPDDKER